MQSGPAELAGTWFGRRAVIERRQYRPLSRCVPQVTAFPKCSQVILHGNRLPSIQRGVATVDLGMVSNYMFRSYNEWHISALHLWYWVTNDEGCAYWDLALSCTQKANCTCGGLCQCKPCSLFPSGSPK